jgi:hypothetical protein
LVVGFIGSIGIIGHSNFLAKTDFELTKVLTLGHHSRDEEVVKVVIIGWGGTILK